MLRCNRHGATIPTALFLLAGIGAGAAVTRLTILSPGHENRVGEEALNEVEKEFGAFTALPALDPYMDRIVKRLGEQSRRKDLPWRVRLLDTPSMYAFPLPGGTVCVSRGTLAALGSEGEVAALLAHEMAHTALRHATLRVYGSDLSSFMRGTLAGYTPELAKRMDGAVNLALSLALCGFSSSEDDEADEEALLMLQRAGYDPACAVALYRRLLDLEERDASVSERYLFAHSATPGRLEKALQVAPEARGDCGAEIHRKACAGLPVGKSSGDAFLADGVYINRAERVRLQAPRGYQAHFSPPVGVVRLARAVRPGDGVVPAEFVLEILPATPGATPDSAADAFVRGRGMGGARPGDRGFKSDDGRPLSIRIADENGRTGLLRTFLAVAVEGERVYILRGTAHIDRYKVDFPEIMGIIRSFRLLSAKEAEESHPPTVGA